MSKADERIQVLEKLLAWLLTGDVGTSSKFMAARFMGIELEPLHRAYPRDVYDFGRCCELVNAVGIDREIMRGAHPVWDFLLDNWDEGVHYWQYGPSYGAFKTMMDRMSVADAMEGT